MRILCPPPLYSGEWRVTHPLTNPLTPGAPSPGMFYNLRAASGRFDLVIYKPSMGYGVNVGGLTYLYPTLRSIVSGIRPRPTHDGRRDQDTPPAQGTFDGSAVVGGWA